MPLVCRSLKQCWTDTKYLPQAEERDKRILYVFIVRCTSSYPRQPPPRKNHPCNCQIIKRFWQGGPSQYNSATAANALGKCQGQNGCLSDGHFGLFWLIFRSYKRGPDDYVTISNNRQHNWLQLVCLPYWRQRDLMACRWQIGIAVGKNVGHPPAWRCTEKRSVCGYISIDTHYEVYRL